MYTKGIKIKTEKKHFILLYRGKPFVKILRDMIPEFYEDLKKDIGFNIGVEEKKKRKKKVIPRKTITEQKKRTQALQLAKRYASMLAKWSKFKKGKVPVVSAGSKDFKHLLSAVDIINRHGVKNKVFLNAQIEGLKFANDGKGIFPKINQLSTTNAELRLVDYLKKDVEAQIRTELTESEKLTPLQENKLYVERYEKVRQGSATYLEGLYVRNCILARRGRVPKDIMKDIEALKKKK